MQKVVIVNLNGAAYHLEESAYSALGAYLERAERQLVDNPDRAEILGDIEQAIADKCRRYLVAHKTVITGAEMATILEEMGPVHDQAGTETGAAPATEPAAEGSNAATDGTGKTGDDPSARDDATSGAPTATTKRLYAMPDTGFISGVCSGLAVYFDLDVALVRIGLTLGALAELVFLHTPVLILAYITAMCVVPTADTSEERAAARGIPFTTQELINEAKRNLGRIGEHDWKHTRRQWRQQRRWERKYQRQMRKAHTWTWNWPAPAPAASYGSQVAAGIMTPLLTMVSVAAFWLTAYAVVSLASTGAVHGWPLPPDVPLWLGILGVVVVYQLFIWPIHLVRRASYYHLGGPDHAKFAALDGLIAISIGLAVVWGAFHYNPEVREWLRHIPEAWHNVVTSFKS
jgi:phage shock protein PspC (stress-responsive transcriptional regulator)